MSENSGPTCHKCKCAQHLGDWCSCGKNKLYCDECAEKDVKDWVDGTEFCVRCKGDIYKECLEKCKDNCVACKKNFILRRLKLTDVAPH